MAPGERTVYVGLPRWANVYAVARTLLALATAGTLVFSSTDTLFRPTADQAQRLSCTGLSRANAFCLVGESRIDLTRIGLVVVLVVVASGWRPRVMGVLHWWAAFSVSTAITIPDGGDQAAQNLTLLLLPLTFIDARRWHWQQPLDLTASADFVGRTARLLIRIQVAVIYLNSSIQKLKVPEWRDGSALYYWLSDPTFGMPGWAAPLLRPLLYSGVGVLVLTWVPLAGEFLVGIAIFLPSWAKKSLLVFGVGLHLSIGVLMGLGSFAMIMWAALLLALWPWDQRIGWWIGAAAHPQVGSGSVEASRAALLDRAP